MKISFTLGDGDQAGAVMEKIPLRILVLADLFSSRGVEPPVTLEQAGDFSELLVRHSPEIFFEVEDALGGRGPLEVRIELKDLKQLTPKSLVRDLPALARGKQLLDRLEAATRAKPPADLGAIATEFADLDGLGEVLQAAAAGERASEEASAKPPAKQESSDVSVDRILDMVDVPEREERAAAAIGSLIGAVSSKKRGAGATPQLRRAIDRTEEQLGRQLDAILHHPRLQEVEAAWRGLKFLVDHSDFRRGVRLDVMHMPRAELRDAFRDKVIEPEIAVSDAVPPALVVAAYELDDPDQAELLQLLAEGGEALQSPLLSAVGAGFFSLEDGAAAGGLRYPGSLLEAPQYAKWNSLRQKDCARWLAVGFNRFLLRARYTKDRQLGIAEQADEPAQRLWGNPAWAIAGLVARSFARSGWPTEMTGNDNGRIEDLPLHELTDQRGRPLQTPLEGAISLQLAEDLARSGFCPLLAPENSDIAFLLRAPTAFQPPSGQDKRAAHALPYQLLVARVVQELVRFKGAAGERTPGRVEKDLNARLSGLISDTGIGASVDVRATPDHANNLLLLQIQLRTGRGVLGGREVELGFAL